MAYSNLTDTEVAGGKSNKTSLWQKIKNNFANHEERITTVESADNGKALDLLFNVGLEVEEDTPTANNLTITLTNALGYDLSATDLAKINFRSATESSGVNSTVEVSTSPTLVIPEGATLGCSDGVEARIFIYAINNSGTVELAISKKLIIFEDDLVTTTNIDVDSDDAYRFYSETARTDVPIRLLGFFETTEATAGNWTTGVSKLYCGKISELQKELQSGSVISFNNYNVSLQDLPNASVSITVDGNSRPVFIGLQPSSATNSALLRVTKLGGAGKTQANVTFILYRGATAIAKWQVGVQDSDVSYATATQHAVGSLFFIDTPDEGTHTYKLQIATNADGRLEVSYAKLVAYEMK